MDDKNIQYESNTNGVTRKYLILPNGNTLLHCEDGPALFSNAGYEYYYMGKLHRNKKQGPAVSYNFRNIDSNNYEYGYYSSNIMRKKLADFGMFEEYWEDGKRIS